MSRRNKNSEEKPTNEFAERVKKIVKGLYYISETDAKILPFFGEKTDSVSKENLLSQICKAVNSKVEERNFEDFFSHLIEVQEWFGEEEKESVQKFSQLKELLQENLKDLKVFRIGEIELDIYVVGLDSENLLTGIKTKSVET